MAAVLAATEKLLAATGELQLPAPLSIFILIGTSWSTLRCSVKVVSEVRVPTHAGLVNLPARRVRVSICTFVLASVFVLVVCSVKVVSEVSVPTQAGLVYRPAALVLVFVLL